VRLASRAPASLLPAVAVLLDQRARQQRVCPRQGGYQPAAARAKLGCAELGKLLILVCIHHTRQ
jgi:hypothetical protein